MEKMQLAVHPIVFVPLLVSSSIRLNRNPFEFANGFG
jgi:hypothetical protein